MKSESMTYVAVEWLHLCRSEPTHLYYELDQQRIERRKVEVFRDGRMQYADASHQYASTWLSLEPHPNMDEIACNPEFRIVRISSAEFNEVWKKALKCGNQPDYAGQ